MHVFRSKEPPPLPYANTTWHPNFRTVEHTQQELSFTRQIKPNAEGRHNEMTPNNVSHESVAAKEGHWIEKKSRPCSYLPDDGVP